MRARSLPDTSASASRSRAIEPSRSPRWATANARLDVIRAASSRSPPVAGGGHALGQRGACLLETTGLAVAEPDHPVQPGAGQGVVRTDTRRGAPAPARPRLRIDVDQPRRRSASVTRASPTPRTVVVAGIIVTAGCPTDHNGPMASKRTRSRPGDEPSQPRAVDQPSADGVLDGILRDHNIAAVTDQAGHALLLASQLGGRRRAEGRHPRPPVGDASQARPRRARRVRRRRAGHRHPARGTPRQRPGGDGHRRPERPARTTTDCGDVGDATDLLEILRKAQFDAEYNHVVIGSQTVTGSPLGVTASWAGDMAFVGTITDETIDGKPVILSTAMPSAPPPVPLRTPLAIPGKVPPRVLVLDTGLRTELVSGADEAGPSVAAARAPRPARLPHAARRQMADVAGGRPRRRRGRDERRRPTDPRLRGWPRHVHRRHRAPDLSRRRRAQRRRAVELRRRRRVRRDPRPRPRARRHRRRRHRGDELRHQPASATSPGCSARS